MHHGSTHLDLAETWREARTLPATAGVHQAAERMVAENAGCLVVVDEAGRGVGMLTDRDLALRVVARPRTIDGLCAADVMTKPLVAIERGEPLQLAVERMKKRGVRRVPVLDGERRPVGLIALDDLLHSLGLELHDLSQEARAHRPPPSELVEREARDLLERLEELLPSLDRGSRERLLARLSSIRAS